jgi:hypothetical protein
MKLVKLKVVAKALILSSLTAGLIACGGGGGGTPATAVPVPVSGKLVPEVRTNGFSAEYDSNANFKLATDSVIIGLNTFVEGIKSDLKWPSDVPVVFAGCGQTNAFFSPGLDFHAALLNDNSTIDPAVVFGGNVTIPAIVMCHELTEKILKTFFLDAATDATIINVFNPTTSTELDRAKLVISYFFGIQVFLHELGHATDTLLLKDLNNTIKMAQFTIPLPNTCVQLGCDTAGNDFADWISSVTFIAALQDIFKADPIEGANLVKAWVVALNAWPTILGGGGGISHGLTQARQVNMLCYAWGAMPEIRTLDAAAGNPLQTAITSQNLDPNNCEATYNTNNAATTALFAPFVNI